MKPDNRKEIWLFFFKDNKGIHIQAYETRSSAMKAKRESKDEYKAVKKIRVNK